MFGLSPWLLGGTAIAFVLATGVAGVTGYNKGYDVADTADQLIITNMQLEAERKATKIRASWQQQSDAAVASLEQDRGKTRVIFRTIMEGVDHLVESPDHVIYRNACFDDDGLRLANAALAGVAVQAPSQPNASAAMPNGNTPDGR